MGQTRYYGLCFFDFGDHLDSSPNPQKEVERFVLIDKQIYGLYNIFGNGVINGWNITDATIENTSTGISVSISPGIGIIRYMAAETVETGTTTNLPPNNLIDIFAVLQGSTEAERSVDFISVISGTDIDYGIRLATIQTGRSGILYINNLNRDLVGFKQLIKDEIDTHRHTGNNKIELSTQTKGQLPGARIEGFDAEKITSGVFDIDRIPLKDHNELENNGLLTHAALDSFVKTLSQTNQGLLGEITSVNLLKALIFWKYDFPNIDEHFLNELVLIPGISPDSFIDWDTSHTTANVNKDSHCISGKEAQTGAISSVFWDDQTSFYNNSYTRNNVVVTGGEVTLTTTGEAIDIIENFNNVNMITDDVPGFDASIVTLDTIQVSTDTSGDNKTEGYAGGRFSASSTQQAIYLKELSPAKNWNGIYDEIVVWVKTTSSNHQPVYMKIINDNGTEENEIGPFTLLENNEVTTNTNIDYNNFEEKWFPINMYDLSNVTKIMIYTDEVNSSFTFYLDNMHVRRTHIVSPTGVIKFRHVAQTNVTFHSILWDSIVPAGTNITFKVRVASSENLLSRSPYTLGLKSGDVFALSGSCCEIEATLTSTLQTEKPILQMVELRMLVNSTNDGFTIATSGDWNRGSSLENVEIFPTQSPPGDDVLSDVIISSPINVGGYTYSFKDAAIEIPSKTNDYITGTVSVSGSFMPITPNQAANWANNKVTKFDFLTTVYRKSNKNFIVTDTRNNRILELSNDGTIVNGFGSTYIEDTELYPLSAIYNPNNSILSMVFSKAVTVVDITKINFYVGGTPWALNSTDIVQPTQKAGSKIIEIQIGDTTKTKIDGVVDNLLIYFNEGAFTESLIIKPIMSALYGARGMTVYVCNFTYIDGIKHPVHVEVLTNNNWIIANSSINYSSSTTSNGVENTSQESQDVVPDIVEINPSDGSIVFSNDSVKFSEYSLGSIKAFDTNRIAIACLVEGGTLSGTTSSSDLINNAGSNVTDKIKFSAAAIDALSGYKGGFVIIDKLNNSSRTIYVSPDGLYPSDLDIYTDEDGDILLSESSFSDNSGRLVIIDSYGNVKWTYGSGMFNIINDARVLDNNNIMVSI